MNLSNLARSLAFTVVGVSLQSCSSAEEVVAIDAGGDAPADAGLSEDSAPVPIPTTSVCTGDAAACLSGTVALKDFTAPPTAGTVTLYRLFPYGDVKVIGSSPVASDGTFAFSDLPAWRYYYLRGEAGFGNGASSVASTVGSFTVPAAPKPIAIVIRPVFLEVLQQAVSGGPTLLGWASAHLYDPASGREVTKGSVSLTANGTSLPMPYGKNAGGTDSFNVNLPADTPGGTTFTITTSYPELGTAHVKWTLVGDPETFVGAIRSPTGAVPVNMNTPLDVKWQRQSVASYSYSQTELFELEGKEYVQRYVSPAVNAPDVTTETIPASALGTSGTYLLNENYANATCPVTADGCVYNLSTAALDLTVQ